MIDGIIICHHHSSVAPTNAKDKKPTRRRENSYGTKTPNAAKDLCHGQMTVTIKNFTTPAAPN